MNLITQQRRAFLSAQWRGLAMLNWQIDQSVLEPLVPRELQLDFHAGKTYVSLVGFLFLDTYLLGLPIPFHRDFEEVNLRFYVRREVDGELRRGVAFVKEIVPKWAIAAVARWWYNEPYAACPMRHHCENYAPRNPAATSQGAAPAVKYEWREDGRWLGLSIRCQGAAAPLSVGSHEAFIAEHYWGYCAQRDGGVVEYRVEHPAWRIWHAAAVEVDPGVADCYPPDFAATLAKPPTSAFLADGSAIKVFQPRRIPA